MGIIVGIDLGTTYSAVATFDKASGTTRMLKNSFNSDTTPSVVCKDNGSIVIGADAKELQSVGNENVASFYKSWMGNDFYKVYLEDDECSPEDLSAIFLRELKRDIEESNRVTIDAAVITVPAYFNDMQREATLRAGTRAGLKVLKIINEPTAAIISYGLTDAGDKKVLVYDLGGGTFDVTVAQISGSTVTVLGTSGDHQLGGKDWDDAIKNHILASFESDFDVSIGDYPEALNELQVECERVKKLLTQAPKASASISCAGRTGRYEITREWFENETFHLLAKTEALIHKCLSDIGLRPDGSDIDEFVLVGGSTRMPQVRQLILNKYKKNAITGVDVDTVVARGAAIQAALCSERTITLSLGAAPSRPGAPAGQRRTFSLSASNIQDVIAHSLGMLSISEDRSRYLNTVIIPKNTKIPSVEQRPFKVRSFRGKNGETEVYILQGESLVPGENHVLGKYVIEGIEPQTEKETVIDIAYSYNENGMVQVSAVQRKTQKQLPVVKHEVPDDVSWMDETPVLPEIRVSSKIYLVIDVSGSMQNAMSKVNRAAKQFVKDIDLTSAKVGVIAFGNEVEMALEPSSDANHINKTIDNVTAFKYDVGKGTAGRPLGFLGGRFGSLDDKNYVVVLTDGEWWNAADEIASSKNLKNKGIEIVALGFAEADQNFLRDIASSSEAALKTDLNRMEGTFSSIAQAITEGQDRITLG